jgi:hypothetical protein
MCDLTPDAQVTFANATLTTPSSARQFVRTRGCPEHGSFAVGALVELVTSELVTNSVLHGRAPITVQLSCLTSEVRLAVSDAGPRLPSAPGTAGSLGLGIVARIAREWGTVSLAPGTERWCRIPTGLEAPARGPESLHLTNQG